MAKPRVIISTDIGGSDNDDMESMAHALTHADQWQIEALISTPTRHSGRAAHIHKALDAYAKDYAKLKTWGPYPTPEYLKSSVYQGNINVAPSAGYSNPTPASKAIIQAAKEAKAAGEPLWVLTWGALTDVAQALHDDPSIMPTLRVLASNGWNYTQDPNAYNYVLNTHVKNGLWMIDSKSTHRGIYINANGVEGNSFNMNEAKGHGALGDYFYNARPWGVKMGDSWSVAYLTDNQNDSNPGANSWGGTFFKNGKGSNYYTDDPNPAYQIASYKGAKHVREHQNEIYKDMYKHFDQAKAAKPGSTTTDKVVDSKPPANKPADTKQPAKTPVDTKPPADNSNDAVVAKLDQYKIDAGDTLWFNTRYATWNDIAHGKFGKTGNLKVTALDKASDQGVTVSWSSDGTAVYKAKPGFNGVDRLNYTVKDSDGHTDTGTIEIKVGNGTSAPGVSKPAARAPDSKPGAGHPVIAADDVIKVTPNKTHYFNTRHLTANDKGADGGLNVIKLDSVSKKGVKVSWGPEDSPQDGTAIYKPIPNWKGVDSLNYTVTDANGSTDTGTVYLNVGNVDFLLA